MDIRGDHFTGDLPVFEHVPVDRGRRSGARLDIIQIMGLKPERIHALCFDVDGTLSDTDDMFVRRLVHWLMPFRFLFPDKKPQALARRLVMATETPANLAFRLLDLLGIDDEIGRAGDYFYRLGLGNAPEPFLLIPGIPQMLQTLRSCYPLSIVSARGMRNTLRFLEQFQLTGYFTSIVTAHTCEHTKPHPDPILWAAKQMGVSPDECLMIGDTVIDIKAGKAAGAQTVGVLCGFGHEEELRQAGADLLLSDTALLSDILKN